MGLSGRYVKNMQYVLRHRSSLCLELPGVKDKK